MKRRSINLFSMVEVALAIGVLAIGLTVLFSMFPVGFNESRKAITESRSSNAAENIFAYISQQGEINSDWDKTGSVINDLPNIKQEELNNLSLNTAEWAAITNPEVQNVYNIRNPNDSDNFFKGIYGTKISTNGIQDIAGEVRIWKEKPENMQIYFNKGAMNPSEYKNAIVGLNIEMSYPVEKPYSQREKYKYYYELFNNDIINNPSDEKQNENKANDLDDGTPPFEVKDGKVTITKTTKFKFEILGTFFAYNDKNMTKAPVYTKIKIIYPDETEEIIKPFGDDPVNNHIGDSWVKNVSEGTMIFIKVWSKGLSQFNDYNTYGPYWSTNKKQSDALVRGQVPPPYTPAGSQPPYNNFIKPYMNAENNTVKIAESQILYLFELNNVPKNHNAYDMQDMVALATLETITTEVTEESTNSGENISGLININPSSSSSNDFILTQEDNSTLTLNNYFDKNDAASKNFLATEIKIRPKGNANRNSFKLNGDNYNVSNSNVYKIVPAANTTLDCTIWNGNKKGKKQGKGRWWISITGRGSVEKL
ncbi:MAG: hypothetical protein GY756_19895 [bacterium]|nr:hypothetical protein [bacterium]